MIRRFVHLDHTRDSFAGDAAGDVDGVAPQVVDELLLADDAGDDRAGADADAYFEVHLVDLEVALQQVAHFEREIDERGRIIAAFVVQTAGDHVGVADGLDLFQAVSLSEFVERRENPVQHGEHLLRRESFGNPREVDDIDEHHRDVGESIRDRLAAVLESFGNRTGKNVEQQALRAILLDLQKLVRLFQPRLRLLLLGCRIAQKQEDDGRDRREVEREEEYGSLDRNPDLRRRQCIGEVIVEESRQRGEEEVSKEPRQRLMRADKEHGADRREQRPQADAARGDEVAHAPLRDKRHEQEERELDLAEDLEVERLHVDDEIRHQQDLENEGDRRGNLRPQLPVDEQPEHRRQADEAGRKDQQRLLQAHFFRIGRQDAGIAKTCDKVALVFHGRSDVVIGVSGGFDSNRQRRSRELAGGDHAVEQHVGRDPGDEVVEFSGW